MSRVFFYFQGQNCEEANIELFTFLDFSNKFWIILTLFKITPVSDETRLLWCQLVKLNALISLVDVLGTCLFGFLPCPQSGYLRPSIRIGSVIPSQQPISDKKKNLNSLFRLFFWKLVLHANEDSCIWISELLICKWQLFCSTNVMYISFQKY